MLKRIGSGDPCWCGSRKPYGQCHQEFDRKVSRARFMGHEVPSHKIIKTPEQIQGIRESGKLNVAVLGLRGRADQGRDHNGGDRPVGV